jgi:quinol monooxygenase YgiN
MSELIVVVDFRLKPGAIDPFRRLVVENARSSLRAEPGCRRFDVVTVEGDPDRIVLYEIYDGDESFAAHLRTPHYAAFDKASEALVAGKTVVRGRLALEASS